MSTRVELRIIPARAGFTEFCICGDSPRRDHPRSRGVYNEAERVIRKARGSSPLARGLRFEYCLMSRFRRIIPARAGFTRTTQDRSEVDGDHPRSRGVYTCGS